MRKLTTNEKLIGGSIAGVGIIGLGYFAIKRLRKKSIINRFPGSTYGTVNVIETAQELGMNLGTAYSFYDPRHWFEDDGDVNEILLKFPKALIPQLTTEYYKLYKRNLQSDLQSMLDNYNEIRYLFV
jgi:hypothetical protein